MRDMKTMFVIISLMFTTAMLAQETNTLNNLKLRDRSELV